MIGMDYFLLIYFFVGIVQDFILTLNFRFIAKDKILSAVISSFVITVISMLVLYDILTRLDTQKSLVAIIVYALGIAAGTYLGMKFKVASREEKQNNAKEI